MSSGIVATGTILDKIIDHKRSEVRESKRERSISDLKAICNDLAPGRDFIAALRKDTVALIAEVKHASPSKGVLIDPFDPVEIAEFYDTHGAAAISVLTDEKFFQGHLDYLNMIREVVSAPLLRKDFIVTSYQVYEARAAGADAILLIVAALEDGLLVELHELATELGLAALVEVHAEHEMERALALEPRLVGVNNRDLRDFTVDLNTTVRLAGMVPPNIVLVGESGIRTSDDVRAMGSIDAILVGETVVKAADRAAVMGELSQVTRQARHS